MKKILSFLKNTLLIILLIISLITINAYMLLRTSSKLISKDNISNIVKEISVEEILGKEAVDEIYESLEEAGISKNYVSSVVENKELKEMIGNFVSGTLESVLESKDLPKIDSKEVEVTLIKVFDYVVEANEDYKISEAEKEEVHQAIKEYTPEIVNAINESEDEIMEIVKDTNSELNETSVMFDSVKAIYQSQILFLIGTLLLLVVIVLLKLKELKFLKWLTVAGILYGVVFLTIGLSIPVLWNSVFAREFAELKTIFDLSINMISKEYNIAGIICIVIGVIIACIKPIMKKINSKKELTNEI